MATIKQIAVLLMLHICTSLDQEPSLVFGKLGGDVMFHFPVTSEEQENLFFYRSLENETMLLMTVKGNETASQSQRISFSASEATASFRLDNVSLSDSGIYTVETRRGEYLIRSQNYYMAICSKVNNSAIILKLDSENQTFRFDTDAFDPSQGEMLEVYKIGEQPKSHFDTLTIGTDVCSQIFPGEPRSGLQVSQNGSSVWLSSRSDRDYGGYYIIIRKGKECQQLIKIETLQILVHSVQSDVKSVYVHAIEEVQEAQPNFLRESDVLSGSRLDLFAPLTFLYFHLAWPGKRVTLPCVTDARDKGKVKWETPTTHLSLNPFITIIHSGSKARKEEMYIETRNYSLIIPSVKSSHSGRYTCQTQYSTAVYELKVCLDMELTYVRFSQNESVVLSCISPTGVTEWYRQREEEIEMLSGLAVIPEDMRDRVYTSDDHQSLIISNLLPQDSGLYRCLQQFYDGPCLSGRFHLVYRHPYGVDSPFYWVYASLLGSGLLLMICAVLYANLRIRGGRVGRGSPKDRGEPTGEPEREEEQRRGDIDI
ncbi:hypothetical protein ACEWY4_008179 [Coilia grayii]|uniref:Ig-like domain-containing protein n=1 Tax=Coilia grayii TaxID=363190 RepID=A0ABD1KAH1_9TELE